MQRFLKIEDSADKKHVHYKGCGTARYASVGTGYRKTRGRSQADIQQHTCILIGHADAQTDNRILAEINIYFFSRTNLAYFMTISIRTYIFKYGISYKKYLENGFPPIEIW